MLQEEGKLTTSKVIEQSAAIAVGWKGATVVPPERNGSAGSRASRRALRERKTPGRFYPAGGAHPGSRRSWPVRATLLSASASTAWPARSSACSCGKLSKRRAVPEARRCRGRKPRGAGSRGTEPGLRWGRDGICRRSAQTGVYQEHRPTANKKRKRTDMQKNAFPCHLKATVPCGRIYGQI